MQIETDALAYWFFRLNGFLTIVNFVVHVERRGQTGTDVDILGVRFPYRAELPENPMPDYPKFTMINDRPYLAIAEVKRGMCNLNGPWVSRERMVMDKILSAIGAFPTDEISWVAEKLYDQGYYYGKGYYVTLVCVGQHINPEIKHRYPDVPQILWSDVKSFIYQRFHKYRNIKSWHQPWDVRGRSLWNWFERSQDEREFSSGIELV